MAEFRPKGKLANYVREFEVLLTKGSEPVSVLGFASADVLVPLRFGDPIMIDGCTPTIVESAAVVGPRTRSTWLRFDGTIEQVKVSFFPGCAGAFLGVPIPELVNQVAAPDEMWSRSFRDAIADLESLSVAERVSRLECLLLAELEPRREPGPQVREAVRLIQANSGRVRVGWLADRVNLSVSQLERSFTRYVGVGPKMLARQTRVSELVEKAMTCTNPDWALLAHMHGYADQSHLAREVREFLSLTPSAFGAIGKNADFLQDAFACPSLD
jgi:AraC-like DNA-binding protein